VHLRDDGGGHLRRQHAGLLQRARVPLEPGRVEARLDGSGVIELHQERTPEHERHEERRREVLHVVTPAAPHLLPELVREQSKRHLPAEHAPMVLPVPLHRLGERIRR
jgi:hypothetical protein